MVLKLASLLFSYCAILFNMFALVKAYHMINFEKSNLVIDYKRTFTLISLTLIVFISNYCSNSLMKVFVSLLSIFLMFCFFFKEKLFITSFKFFIIYLILSLMDLLVSIVFLFFPVSSSLDIGNITVLKGLCTMLDSLMILLIFTIDSFSKIVHNLVSNILTKNSFFLLFSSSFALIVFISIAYVNASNFKLTTFVLTLLLMCFFLFLCFVMIFQYFQNKHKEEEQKSLLNLMTEYERILDNDRMNRHEMLNNLVTLKTFKNKSSKDYEKLLDDIIKGYQLKKTEFYSKLYKLPSGIKGIIYYKIANIKDKNVNVELLISKEVKNNFENLDSRLYFRVCKILGIIIDNAFEASSESLEKYVLIDIYLENENIIFYIENSFSNNIDLSKMTDKGKSSKGENRGYGLFIANKLVKEKDDISLEQHVNKNIFVSILTIKKPLVG